MTLAWRTREEGHVVFVALLFVLVSVSITLGYLRFVVGERIQFLQRLARVRARYNAEYGLAEKGYPFITSPNFTMPDTVLAGHEIPEMRGSYRDVVCQALNNPLTNRNEFRARATGVSYYNGFTGVPVEVTYTEQIVFQPVGFEEYMYFTNEEKPGGGPWLGTYVSFGANDVLEGVVFSNDDITMSQYGCPTFTEDSDVGTAGTFIMNGCNEDQVFQGTYEDSMPEVQWPPFAGQERVRAAADYFFDATTLISPGNPSRHDTLIMTEIDFSPGSFTVKRWAYVIPPVSQAGMFTGTFWDTLKMYYPKKFRDLTGMMGVYTGDIEFQHFDFPEPTDVTDYIEYRTIYDNEAVIWIEGGQVRVKGIIGGRYTVATSSNVVYRMHYNNATLDTMPCNIWIIDDLIYEDSSPTGRVTPGSRNRLGLLSGGNVIVANTRPNGAKNQAFGSNVIINAAIIAMNESFLVHYWQNTTSGYNFVDLGGQVKGDGRGPVRFGGVTGSGDIRGTITLWGSVTQAKRGYVKRNAPGPYSISPGIGYNKNYHYDYNLRDFPPPHWPETRLTNGGANLKLTSYGAYEGS